MTNLAEIAAGLTEAQRSAILSLDEKRLRTARQIGRSGSLLKGLTDLRRRTRGTEPPIQLAIRDYVDSPYLAWAYRLTPLGLAVRDHLLASKEPNNVD